MQLLPLRFEASVLISVFAWRARPNFATEVSCFCCYCYPSQLEWQMPWHLELRVVFACCFVSREKRGGVSSGVRKHNMPALDRRLVGPVRVAAWHVLRVPTWRMKRRWEVELQWLCWQKFVVVWRMMEVACGRFVSTTIDAPIEILVWSGSNHCSIRFQWQKRRAGTGHEVVAVCWAWLLQISWWWWINENDWTMLWLTSGQNHRWRRPSSTSPPPPLPSGSPLPTISWRCILGTL